MAPRSNRKTVGYIRVSTEEQSHGRSLPHQTAQLETSGVDEIYSDVESGASSTRPGFVKLIEGITEGEIGTIKVSRWDRLTRNSNEFPMLKDILRDNKVKLIVLEQGGEQDLSTAAGELQADINVLFAAYERALVRDRVRGVMANRRLEKNAWTRPPLLYEIVDKQYVLSCEPCVCSLEDRPKNYLKYDENTPLKKLLRGQSKRDIAEEIVNSLIELRKYRSVLSRLHNRYTMSGDKNPYLTPGITIFSSSAGLKNWLQNPILRGHIAYLRNDSRWTKRDPDEWEIHFNTHVEHRLFDDEFYENELKPLLEANAKRCARTKVTSHLTNLIFCAECHSRCILKSGNAYKYYGCRHSGVSCTNRKCVRVDDIDEAIIFKLTERVRFISQAINQFESLSKSDTVRKLEAQVAWLESAPNFKTSYQIQKQRRELLEKIEKEKSNSNEIAKQMLCNPQAGKINFWYSLSENLREIFYEKLLDKVFIADEVVSVSLKV
ncbi:MULTISPECIES: recombinase family protein [Trichocoleus]|uniref:Recombinase family protein n=1 Tax=Trichocoleus desertorum GB2-A4 TaxID=2933944 RepID=A0ABV0JFI4_9CYAN|nr:recombinase family protein [Trichocoleus sp. FACHB-46]MBD1863041.1 recombinase family protein [Trichocoleus sp. FACHB-46]